MDRRLGRRPLCWARIAFPSRSSGGLFPTPANPGILPYGIIVDELVWFWYRQSPFPGRVSFALGRSCDIVVTGEFRIGKRAPSGRKAIMDNGCCNGCKVACSQAQPKGFKQWSTAVPECLVPAAALWKVPSPLGCTPTIRHEMNPYSTWQADVW
jgi:hypothetical protein